MRKTVNISSNLKIEINGDEHSSAGE